MDASQYKRWTDPMREVPVTIKIINVGNKIETALFYIAYPLLIVILAVTGNPLLLKAVAVPAVAFALVSVFRKVYNAPRPYEVLDIDPLIHKDTKGKSMPSRHVFSVFMIAMTWLAFCKPVGIVMMLLGLDMAVIRVLGGVHFPKDVLVGALVGIVAGLFLFL